MFDSRFYGSDNKFYLDFASRCVLLDDENSVVIKIEYRSSSGGFSVDDLDVNEYFSDFEFRFYFEDLDFRKGLR